MKHFSNWKRSSFFALLSALLLSCGGQDFSVSSSVPEPSSAPQPSSSQAAPSSSAAVSSSQEAVSSSAAPSSSAQSSSQEATSSAQQSASEATSSAAQSSASSAASSSAQTSSVQSSVQSSSAQSSTAQSSVQTSSAQSASSSQATTSSSKSSSAPLQTYTVLWHYDGKIKTDRGYRNGEIPSFGNSDPVKAEDERYTYTFDHWDPEIVPINNAGADYTAVFTKTEKTFTVTWKDEDGSVLKTDTNVAWDTLPSYGENPTKESSIETDYAFDKWLPTIAKVHGDATYTASYQSSKRKYTITWLDEDGQTPLGQPSVLEYGATPTHETPASYDDPESEGYEYVFDHWDPAITAVSGDASYKAVYVKQAKKFAITWLDDEDNLIDTTKVEYGALPTHDDPAKDSTAQYTYSFTGWDPEIVAATENATYKATFSSSVNKYTITWKNGDTVLETDQNVEYGAAPVYNGTTPTKAEDSSYTYTFKEWSPAISTVTGDQTYTATFTKTAKPVEKPDTIYFTNNKNWSSVYAYAWNSTGNNHAWPGVAMTFHKVNENSEQVYKITGMSSYDKVIFNANGGSQTVDIDLSKLGTDNAYYLKNETDGSGHYKVGTWYESGESGGGASIDTKNYGMRILHCFDWKLATIQNNLANIAAQGFNAIQTSPLQAVKDYDKNYEDTHDSWWAFYQPVSLSVANSTYNNLFSTSDGAAELSALCEAAAGYGIRVIVDVVVNHLGDNGSGGFHTQVAQFEPNIYNNSSTTLHHYSGGGGAVKDIVWSNITCVDLNTANSIVQGRALDYLKQLIDCGVTGFRFDAAKHIETKYDSGCGSSFWENTLGAAKTYAAGKNVPLFSYGEILNGTEGGRSYGQYLSDAGLNAVTDSVIGEKARNNLDSEMYYYTGGLAGENVVFGESHDEYMNHKDSGWADQAQINYAYSKLANKDVYSNLLYFVRPDTSEKIKAGGIGYRPDWGWQNGDVRTANLAHKG